jgi:MtrB/PioB family decaheme-associated outer membrane protein
MTPATIRLLVSMALAAQAGTLAAQQAPNTSQWQCNDCPFPKEASGEVAASALNVTSDSYAFGRYTGLEKGGYFGLDVDAVSSEPNGDYFSLYATDLGLPYGALDFETGVHGRFKLNVRLADLPYRISDSGRTPYEGVGTNSLTLAPGWVPGITTATMPGLAGSLREVDIDSKRRRADIGAAVIPGRDWEVGVSFKQEQREGTKRMSGAFFFNSMQLVAPVNYLTEEVEAYASYAARKWQVRLAYQGSTFTDNDSALKWQNAFVEVLPGASYGQLALPPDNQAHQVSVTGAYQFTDRTRGTASLALGSMKQNETFLPATINPTLGSIALPRNSLEGEVATTRADVKLVSALTQKLGLNIAYLRDDRDNKTPQAAYTWVTTDMIVAPTTRTNTPYSYTRDLLKVSGDYRVTPRAKASLGVDREDMKRTYQEVDKTTENTLWAKYTLRTREHVDVTLDAARAKRDGSSYQDLGLTPPENPVLRKYNMADRDRDTVGIRVAMIPWDGMTLGFDYNLSKDDYSNSAVGMTYAKRYSMGTDLAAQVAEGTSVHVYYNFEEIKSQQAGAQSLTNPPDWSAENVDTVQTAGIGIRHTIIQDKLDVGADLTTSHSVGDVKVTVSAADPKFPNITSDMNSVKVHATYRLTKALAIRGAVWHERYNSSSWATNYVTPTTMPNVLSLGETSPNYKVSVASLTVRYSF